ncbi:MAG: glycosyltransferase [Caldilineaceae bacterium]|nr:glycosyltransferase [Caldilineaceae bacterium]
MVFSPVDEGVCDLTVIVPAYNEAATIADTIRSLQMQTIPPRAILVVDDCSQDETGAIARDLGVTVLRPPSNTGSKAGAQNFALAQVQTEYTMAIDADTMLASNGIERLMGAFSDVGVAAACGFVLPRYVRSLWERGRYIEYMFAFNFYKQIQDYYQKPMIASGCFSAYRTEVLKAHGGWQTRTLAEDMDLTWSFYTAGQKVRFIPEALAYPIEPYDFTFMRKQLRRWSHGFAQNLRLHWDDILSVPFLRSMVGIALWDAIIASIAYLFLLPLLSILVSPLFLLVYLIDLPAVLIPVLSGAMQRREIGRAVGSLPAFLILRMVNGIFLLEAFWSEFVRNQRFTVYEKGH